MNEASGGYRLQPVGFAELPGWQNDDPTSLWPAMADCLAHLRNTKPYRTGSLGLSASDLIPLLESAARTAPANAAEARSFFEVNCRVLQVVPLQGSGLVTAFYEPEVEVSAVPDAVYRFPFYARPHDLVDVTDANRPSGLETGYAFALEDADGLKAYPDRKAIDCGRCFLRACPRCCSLAIS
jgi:membrane-bound lytic murein transglycosylase A